jgi:hypothetical protein
LKAPKKFLHVLFAEESYTIVIRENESQFMREDRKTG